MIARSSVSWRSADGSACEIRMLSENEKENVMDTGCANGSESMSATETMCQAAKRRTLILILTRALRQQTRS